jgi:hypothetical protein
LAARVGHGVVGESNPGRAAVAGRTGLGIQVIDSDDVGLCSRVHGQPEYNEVAIAVLRGHIEAILGGKFVRGNKAVLQGDSPNRP